MPPSRPAAAASPLSDPTHTPHVAYIPYNNNSRPVTAALPLWDTTLTPYAGLGDNDMNVAGPAHNPPHPLP